VEANSSKKRESNFHALEGTLLHERMRIDKNTAFCSFALWDTFSEESKQKAELEEMMVIAIGRYHLATSANRKHTPKAVMCKYSATMWSYHDAFGSSSI
jgi:hypothetical protein